MTPLQFTVHLPTSKKRLLYACGIIFILPLAVASFYPGLTASFRFLCYGGIMFVLAMMAAGTMVRYDVKGTVIKVRTSLGRKYQVSCGEITFIDCKQTHHHRHGTDFSITVASDRNYFTVSGQLNNFDLFARYLLNRLADGEIKPSAVSEDCKVDLEKYQQSIYPK